MAWSTCQQVSNCLQYLKTPNVAASAHLPPLCPPDPAPHPPYPALCIVQPRRRAEDTYIFESTIWQLVIPSVLNLCHFVPLGVDLDYRIDGLFFANSLDNRTCFKIHRYRVARARHLVGKPLNLGKGSYESILLRRKLFASFSIGDRNLKFGIVCPQR